LTNLETFSDNK